MILHAVNNNKRIFVNKKFLIGVEECDKYNEVVVLSDGAYQVRESFDDIMEMIKPGYIKAIPEVKKTKQTKPVTPQNIDILGLKKVDGDAITKDIRKKKPSKKLKYRKR